MAHKHAAEVVNHLADASRFLMTPGMVVLANAMARPLVGIHLPLMQTFIDEAKEQHEWKKQARKADYHPIDKICVDQNLLTFAREWVYQKEGTANRQLAAVVT